jgi:hypothetical protein
MVDDDDRVTQESLVAANQVCRSINGFLKILFAVFCTCWLFATALLALSWIRPDNFGEGGGSSLVGIVLFLADGVVIAAMFVIFIRAFTDVAAGKTPFAMIQVKRLRVIALLLIFYAILDFAITANSSLLNINGLDSGFFSTNDNAIIPLNFGPLIAAGVLLAFSYVFKYGVLLQKFSDDSL